MNKKNGFTLVELLAVIVILAVILIIAMPKVSEVIKKTRLSSLETTTKMLLNAAEKKYTENQVLDNDSSMSCSDVVKLNDSDYGTCKITFDSKGNASVILNGKKNGKFDNLTCSGTKGNISCSEGQTKVQLKCNTGKSGLTQGDEYVNGQYTYKYKKVYNSMGWSNSDIDGWGVILTDNTSTDPVTSELCSTIDDKPIVSMAYMFLLSQAPSIDLSSFDTSNVIDMKYMFYKAGASSLDLSSFDTSNVTDMKYMFFKSLATNLDVLGFNTSNVTSMEKMFSQSHTANLNVSSFDTSKVTNMSAMFNYVDMTNVNLSNFDTSNVTNMSEMFTGCKAKNLNLSNFVTSKVTNMAWMFRGIEASNINLSSFNTSNVTDMQSMFADIKVPSLNLSSFDTSKVTDMSFMFQNADIATLDLSSFTTSKITNTYNMRDMFKNAKSTTGYAKTCNDATKYNNSTITNIPSTLTFTVKDTTC